MFHRFANEKLLWPPFPISICRWLLSHCSTADRRRSFTAPVLVARGLRILQDFAGFCRGKCWIFFVFRVSGLTHNLLVLGSNPSGPTKNLRVVNQFRRTRPFDAAFLSPLDLPLGIICGLAAVGFSKTLYWVEDRFERLPIDELWWPATQDTRYRLS